MIFYFSGTGNSFYIAKKFLSPSEKLINISDALNKDLYSFQISQDEKVGFVVPVHNHSLPLLVKKFLNSITLNYVNYVYCIFTCASNIGNADTQIFEILHNRNIYLKYVDFVIMPDNCVFSHDIQDNKSAGLIISNSKSKIKKIKDNILQQMESTIKSPSFFSKIIQKDSSLTLQTNKFYATDDCIECGLCEKKCPEKLIEIVNRKPNWNKSECSQCSVCINQCPTRAIQYGKETKNRNRYIIFDTVINVDIYFDKDDNLLFIPYISNENDVSSMSYHYSILEKGYTEADFENALNVAIDISEKNLCEFPNESPVWTNATGIKSFKTFSKKYSCIMFCYVLTTNTGSIQLLKRESNGSYGPYSDDYKKTYKGMPSAQTVYEVVMSLMSICK